MRRYSAKLDAETDATSRSRARVGVNTGEVVVRSIVTGAGQVEYTPIGHSTSLAARMQTFGADRLNRGDRCDPQAVRGILRLQVARPGQD